MSLWTTGDTTLNRAIDNATFGSLAANTRIGSLRFNNGAVDTVLNLASFGLTLGVAAETGGILIAEGTSATISINGGAVNPGGAALGTGDTTGNTTLYIHHNGSGLLDIQSKITGSSNAGLTKTGEGTLRLSGTNSFSAPVTLTAGVIEAMTLTATTTLQSLGRAADVQIFNSATLRLLNSTDTTTNKRLQLGIGGGTLALNGSGTTVTFSGQTTTIASGSFLSAVYRVSDGETPDFTITGAGNAIFDGGIYLSTPDKVGNSSGGEISRNLADAVTLSRFTMSGTGTITCLIVGLTLLACRRRPM